MIVDKWDTRFLNLAEHIASWSKHPRKKVGAVIVRPDRTIAGEGFNGPPRGFDDAQFDAMAREDQHAVTVHAEQNAMHAARESLDGFAIYIHGMTPCAQCAAAIVQRRIARVVFTCGHVSPDWMRSWALAEQVLRAGNVIVKKV
jgi:dCMP deaminase